jgi:hypothetical protein
MPIAEYIGFIYLLVADLPADATSIKQLSERSSEE